MSVMKARRIAIDAVVALAVAATALEAQPRWSSTYAPTVPIPEYDRPTAVFREHIEVILPPTYLLVRRPGPPIRGFYAWKFTFGYSPVVTIVFRPDSAVSATNDREVIRASALYLCKSPDDWVLECTIPIRGTARVGAGGVVVDISEPEIVARIREAKPGVLLRQLFEPGGRFRVDDTGITMDGKLIENRD